MDMEIETNGTETQTDSNANTLKGKALGLQPPGPGRLPTFKVPRNLTLSGVRGTGPNNRTKHVFVPNIPARRITSSKSNDPTDDSNSSDSSAVSDSLANRKKNKKAKNERERKSKEKPSLVQSGSIFGEGVGDGSGRGIRRSGGGSGEGRFTRSSGRDRGDDRDPKSAKDKFVLDKDKSMDQDDAFDDDKFLTDWDDGIIDPTLKPLHLPLAHCLKEIRHSASVTPIPAPTPSLGTSATIFPPSELAIKAEPGVEPIPQPQLVPNLPFGTGIQGFRSFAQVLSTPDSNDSVPPGLLFLQLPDLVPLTRTTPSQNMDIASSDKDSKSKTASSTSTKETSSLSSLSDGCIGKVQILASGKTRLIIGDNIFDITPAKEASFQQEIVTIDTEDQTIGMLGPVQQKFLCTLDLECLLNNVKL